MLGATKFIVFSILILFIVENTLSLDPPYGQLKITDKHVTKEDGTIVQLRGMSLAWSINTTNWSENWFTPFWKSVTVAFVKCSWNSNVIRAPMGIMFGGYLENPETEYEKVKTIIDAAIDMGIYVIVDWHDERAHYENHTVAAIQFFSNISQTYGNYSNIIYEIFNEPVNATWAQIKAYAVRVITAIRQNDQKNIIVVGTPNWSTDVDVAAEDPINGTNIAYTLHIYAASAGQKFFDKATAAINKSLPLFVTEYGVVESSGNGPVNETNSQAWWNFWDENKLSYVNWGMYDKNESAAAMIPNSTPEQVGDSSRWTIGGTFVNQMLWSKDQNVSCVPQDGIQTSSTPTANSTSTASSTSHTFSRAIIISSYIVYVFKIKF